MQDGVKLNTLSIKVNTVHGTNDVHMIGAPYLFCNKEEKIMNTLPRVQLWACTFLLTFALPETRIKKLLPKSVP